MHDRRRGMANSKVIESRKATVRTDKPIPLSQVRDLTLLRELQKELRLQ